MEDGNSVQPTIEDYCFVDPFFCSDRTSSILTMLYISDNTKHLTANQKLLEKYISNALYEKKTIEKLGENIVSDEQGRLGFKQDKKKRWC